MKLSMFIFIIALAFACKPVSTEDKLKGNWEIESWMNLTDSKDLMKDPNTPEFKIAFKTDSVYILEKEKNKTRDYTYDWSLKNDTLSIQRLGDFKISTLNDDKLILRIKVKNIFSKHNTWHTDEITLVKR